MDSMTSIPEEPSRSPILAADGPLGEEQAVGQYVTCYVGDECFAFPMESVLEIIRLPDAVRVPLAPSCLRGLANLRGAVLPVVDLRMLLGLAVAEPTDATRVVVVDCGRPIGLIVDRMERVIGVEPERIEPSADVRTTVDTELLAGVIKPPGGEGALIQLLDAQALVAREFSLNAQGPNGVSGGPGVEVGADRPGTKDEDEVEGQQLVSFGVDQETYAFEISEVQEIVRVPDEISRVPGAGDHVLGIIDLRGRVLPLVSLRRLFGLGEVPLDDNHRILVVSVESEAARAPTVGGVVVDRVYEVFHTPEEGLEPVPAFLEKQGVEGVQAICRLANDNRLVSVLTGQTLFRHPSVQEALRAQKEGEEVHVDKRPSCSEAGGDENLQFVVFRLAGQEYGVEIGCVQEIIWVPEEMSRVPKTPEFIEGVVNLRGTVLPVMDMRTRFGLEKMERNDGQRILVLNLEGTRTGFIVDAVSEVLRVPADSVEAAPRLSEAQTRIVAHVVNLKEHGRVIQILEARELLAAGEHEAVASAMAQEAATDT